MTRRRRVRRVRTTGQARCLRAGILAARHDWTTYKDAGHSIPQRRRARLVYWEVILELARTQRRRQTRARTAQLIAAINPPREEHS